MAQVYCPDCDGRITLASDARMGLLVFCPHCDAELEVIGTNPLEVDWADSWEWDEEEEEEESW